jgi:aspartate 1-decarboxylase
MGTNYQDAAPVAISGQVGSTVSLYDMLKQAYGDNVNQIQSVFVGQNAVFGSYWNPADPHATQISATGTINFADFKNVQITIGNNINSNIFVTLPENSNWDAMRTLSVTALQQNLDANLPADHVPTAADIVSTAKMFASTVGGVANSDDCHGIASDIAASAGATLDSNTGSTGLAGEPANEAGGFWRIAAGGIGGGDAWQSQVQAGDIVRMRVVNGNGSVTEHTVTVTGALNSDPQNPGKIMVVDNSNGVISEHPADLNTVAGSVTIYRLATDGQYLIDQSAETHNITIQGDNFNDLIKVGGGSDTVQGGAGIDTAVLAGNKADYQIVHNADGSVSVSGHGVTDNLVSVEKIQFNDQTVDLSPAAPAPAPDPAPAPAPVAGSVSINDVQITEGNDGQQIATFTVTRTGGNAAFDLNFATADGSATTADGDYVAKSGTLHFAQGDVSQTVSVVINGDTKVEGNENFHVNLSGVTNGATISHAQGTGIIVNDDAAPVAGSVSINDVQITEGNNGQQIETFTLTRAGGNAAFDVNFATADGSATAADGDYVAKSGTAHFAQGDVSQTVSVVINGDTKVEGNENFHVNLSGATNGATISHAEGTGNIINDDVAPAPVTHHVANDFNGDGISDVLFENGKGSVAMWQMNGDHIASSTTVGSVGSDWHSIGISDFNGDGKADVLWENSKGQVAEWQMNGDHIASNTTVGSVGTDWHAIGTGDFNGDGKADVLWENSKGQVAEWQMNGDHIASNTTVGSVGTDWHAIATGDFNGDGKADVLWENSKGQVAEWQMNGDHIASNTTVGSVGTDWKVAATGDFNGDGKTDVLWQNANGKLAEWQMNGDHVASNTTVGNAAGSTVIGTGDYNHDGKADVLLQNASGHVTEQQMDGDHVTDNETVGSHSINWHAI